MGTENYLGQEVELLERESMSSFQETEEDFISLDPMLLVGEDSEEEEKEEEEIDDLEDEDDGEDDDSEF